MTRNRSIQRRTSAFAALAAISLALACALTCATPAYAISRATILARGQHWVDLHVPYSQSSFFEGYRQDCSGFLSMCWVLTRNGAPISLSTADLDAPSLVTPIAKEELQPGDMILRPKDLAGAPYGHAVLFVRWANPEHTAYVGFHESSSGSGAVMATISYPFWGETGFSPYRYLGVDDDYLDAISPVYGADRYATAVQASWVAFPGSAKVGGVVLATGENWPDALGGAALAGAVNGPVLLTQRDTLPASVRDEIARLAPERVFILGGPSSVSTAVADAVAALGAETTRIGGSDRYETATLVALATRDALAADGRAADGAYLATGRAFPDALAASPVAYAAGRPILLTEPSALPTVTADALGALEVARVWALGGESAVSATITAGLEASGTIVARISGTDRYETALALASHGVDAGLAWTDAGIATGTGFADALAGGAAQGAAGSVLLLTPGDGLVGPVAGALDVHAEEIGKVRCFGGTAAIGDVARAQIAAVLRGQ